MDHNERPTAHSFEQLYIKERKKGRIFMATTGVAIVLSLGSFAYASNKKAEAPEQTSFGSGPTSQFNGDMPQGGGPGGGGPNMQMDVTQFLNDDGSVDTAQVNDMLERVPDDFRENMLDRIATQIDEAQQDGDITADQATALKSAFGIAGGTDES
jgi:hypothetical protein